LPLSKVQPSYSYKGLKQQAAVSLQISVRITSQLKQMRHQISGGKACAKRDSTCRLDTEAPFSSLIFFLVASHFVKDHHTAIDYEPNNKIKLLRRVTNIFVKLLCTQFPNKYLAFNRPWPFLLFSTRSALWIPPWIHWHVFTSRS